MENTEETKDTINVINLQLPQFNSNSPDLWFSIVEADFGVNNIRNDTQKYVQLLKALPFNIVEQLHDIIQKPPEKDKYITIKSAILNRFSISRKKQLQKLLNERVVGDKKPSQLLRDMRALAQDSVGEEVLHELWLERLPPRIRPILIISESLGLDALAEVADRCIETLDTFPVMAIHNCNDSDENNRKQQSSINTSITQQYSEMKNMLDDMKKQIENIQAQQERQEYNRHSYRRNSRPRSRRSSPRRRDICYYHTKFGNNARRCQQPCNYNTTTQPEGN